MNKDERIREINNWKNYLDRRREDLSVVYSKKD